MHKDWCGKPCDECTNPCKLDRRMPCSPGCECLGPNGETNCAECQECDALPLFRVPICYDGFVLVRAEDEEDARNRVCDMNTDKMYEKSNGTWNVGSAEAEDE